MTWRVARNRNSVVLILIAFVIFMIYLMPASNQLSASPVETHFTFSSKYESVSNSDQHIHAADMFQHKFKVEGHRFGEQGTVQYYQHSLESSVIHSFSPYTEDRVREIMLEPRHEQRIYANSPAILWHKGEIICVMRIWLEKEKYMEEGAHKPPNDFNDNFLYTQKFNRQMKPKTPGSILGIPTPRQWLIGDGPIEPRLFKTDDENVFVSFNTGVYLQDGRALDGTFIWDYLRHKTLVPSIRGGSPIQKNVDPNKIPRDKHWTPYNDNNTLKMVYNLDPLRVLTCDFNFSCHFNHFEGPKDYKFTQHQDSLRGGTPWVLYKYPYYYSISHSTLFKNPSSDRIYTINLIVYRAAPTPRVVYLSGPIQIHEKPMNDVPIVRYNYIRDPFFFPVSLVEEDSNSIIIGGHINDYSSVLLRVRGVQKLLEEVVNDDRKMPAHTTGPPLGTLHSSTKKFASKQTNSTFF